MLLVRAMLEIDSYFCYEQDKKLKKKVNFLEVADKSCFFLLRLLNKVCSPSLVSSIKTTTFKIIPTLYQILINRWISWSFEARLFAFTKEKNFITKTCFFFSLIQCPVCHIFCLLYSCHCHYHYHYLLHCCPGPFTVPVDEEVEATHLKSLHAVPGQHCLV